VNIPVGAGNFITITIMGQVSPSAMGTLSNTATVTAGAGQVDPNGANNSSTDVDTLLPAAVFVVNNVTQAEGNAGTTPFTFTVTKTGATGFPTSVQYTTQDGTASVADNDYQPTSGTLTFLANETTKTVTVLVNGDTKFESDETFTLHLFNPVNALIGNDGTGTIVNDDVAPNFTVNNVDGLEGDIGQRAFRFQIFKTGSTGVSSTVCYNTIDGTATVADNDYVPLIAGPANCVVFAPGDTVRDVIVFVNGDFVFEPNETFFLHLISATPGTVSTIDGIGTILNDDVGGPPPPPPGGNPEGDINRPALGVPGPGDGFVDVRDSAQFDRFADGRDCPQVSPNEFQRYDDGPLATLGDARITSSDRTQLDRYIAGLDALRPAGGPTAPITVTCTAPSGPDVQPEPETEAVTAARITRLVTAGGNAGTDVTVYVEADAQGNEVATQYSLNFNPRVMSLSNVSGSNPDVTVGAGAPTGTTITVNASQAANGHIGIVENYNGAGTGSIKAGTKRIAAITFHILADAPTGASAVVFDNGAITDVASDAYGTGLGTTFDQNGVINVLNPNVAGIEVSGRVTTPDGRGLRNATVTMTDQNGIARFVSTSSFGYYTFNVEAGGMYRIGVASRQYRFAARTVQITDSLTDVDFVGLE